ncbi:MAG: hypothetical protein PHT96_12735 [Syntrophorhabdaceae bacterium]|nr:hypothetical protein [Syntrophorhabdaceae bacterium]MDD4197254.1 hypothetical protein [Syntrophorhabdaceae bacterium]
MIKRKGVCDVCSTEFELSDGSFAIRIVKDNDDRSSRKWTITLLSLVNDTPAEGFSHVCGETCLFRAIERAIEKRTEECRFRIIGYDGTDDSAIEVVDLKDKRPK